MKKLYERLIDALINKDAKKSTTVFHTIVTKKTRSLLKDSTNSPILQKHKTVESFENDDVAPNGLPIYDMEGEMLIFLQNVPDTLSQKQFDRLVSRYFSKHELEILRNIPFCLQVITNGDEFINAMGLPTEYYTMQEYVAELKEFLRQNFS